MKFVKIRGKDKKGLISGLETNIDFYNLAIKEIVDTNKKISISKMKDYFNSSYLLERNLYNLDFEKYRIYGTIEDLEFNRNGFNTKKVSFERIFKISPFLKPHEFIENGYLRNLFTEAFIIVNVKAMEGTIREFKKFRRRNNLPKENKLI